MKKKVAHEREESLESTLSSIDLSTLKICREIYRRLKSSEGGCYLTEIAKELDIDPDVIHRKVAKLEGAMAQLMRDKRTAKSNGDSTFQAKGTDIPTFYLFDRRRGAKATLPRDSALAAEVESIFFNIDLIVNAWDRISHRWGAGETVVRIATSLYAARKLVPDLLQGEGFTNVWFEITQTKTERLLEIARRKKCDLVLTEVPHDFIPKDQCHVFDFSLVLVAPRGHWLELEDGVENLTIDVILSRLANENTTLCLLPDEPEIYPRPDYPNESHLPASLRVLRIGSTTLCVAMVMSSSARNPNVTITIPQFLTEEDLERLVIIPITPRRRAVKMALLRPNRPSSKDDIENSERTKLVTRIEQSIAEKLYAAATQFESDGTQRQLWIYHSTMVLDKPCWQRGRLTWHSRAMADTSVHAITGTHSITTTEQGLSYLLRGRAVTNRADSHVSYRARSIGGKGDDSYVFSGFCPRFDDYGAGAICGTWHGVFSQVTRPKGTREFIAGSGYAIITTEGDADINYLNETVRLHCEKHKWSLAANPQAFDLNDPSTILANQQQSHQKRR